METIINDIRHGFRTLLKRPAFTVLAVITLALGVGATTAIFSVVNGLLLRPLPYHDDQRLVTSGKVTARQVWLAKAFRLRISLTGANRRGRLLRSPPPNNGALRLPTTANRRRCEAPLSLRVSSKY